MNRLYAVFIVLLLSIFVVGCNPSIRPESDQKTTEQIEKSVVRIRAENQKGGVKEGTGFVVGVSNDKAYVITVSHVVKGDHNPTVEFFEDNKFKAELLDSEPQKNGLALLSVKGLIPYDVMPLYLVKKRNLKSGDALFTIGFPRGGARWARDELSYSGKKMRNLLFSGSEQKGGSSGSPVIKEEQIVAIITSVTNYAYATSAESIREFLDGAKGGKQVVNNMEKWKPSTWRETQKARLETFVIFEPYRKELEKAEKKAIEAKQIEVKLRNELAQTKDATAKLEAKIAVDSAEQARKQAEMEALQAKENIEKARQQRVIMSSQIKIEETNKTVFQDYLSDGSLGPKMVWI